MSGNGYSQGQRDANAGKPKDPELWKQDYLVRQNYEKGYQSGGNK